MPEQTKRDESKCENAAEKPLAKKSEADVKANWSEDQKEKSYYYDDSYGYEVYNPDEEEDIEDE